MLGSFEVTALSDGVIRLPADKLLLNTTPQQIAAGLAERHQSLPVVTSVNAYLINTGDKLVMIDSGAGQLLGDGRASWWITCARRATNRSRWMRST